MVNIAKRPDGRWRARYRGPDGRQFAKHFERRSDARRWLDEVSGDLATDRWTSPELAGTTVAQWCENWIDGYSVNRASTVRQARVHLAHIVDAFGDMPLREVRPSHVRTWVAALKRADFAPSYVYALHRRLSQVMADAVHDGLMDRNPCSRRTSPRAGAQRPYVASTAQVWALYDAFPGNLKPAVLLGAFVGLRTAEVCGLRVQDVDVAKNVITPTFQYPQEDLKRDSHRTPLPVPEQLTALLVASIGRYGSGYVVSDGRGRQIGPRTIDRAMREARDEVGMPTGFRFHDLRHYLASLLISKGLDVKVVQHRLRHASATTTLNIYAHMWPDADESARAAVGSVLADRLVEASTESRSASGPWRIEDMQATDRISESAVQQSERMTTMTPSTSASRGLRRAL